MKIGLTCRAKIAMSKQCTLTSFFDLLSRRPVVESADFDEQVQELERRAAAALQEAQDISVDAQNIHRDLTECINKEPARKKPAAADATATAMVQELGVDAQKRETPLAAAGTSRCPLSFTLSAHLPELTRPSSSPDAALLRGVKQGVEDRHLLHVLDKAKKRDSAGLATFSSSLPPDLLDCLREASKNNPKVSSRRARAVFVFARWPTPNVNKYVQPYVSIHIPS